jgi:hypothetical protein
MKLHSKEWNRYQATAETGDTRQPNRNVSRRNRRCNNDIYFKDEISKRSKLYHTYPPQDSAIPDVEELLRRKEKARKTRTISTE